MSKPAITIDNLSKAYHLGEQEAKAESFGEAVVGLLKAPLRRLQKLGERETGEDSFWALRDVSFDVNRGEVFGLVGRNGAGKSTLLKILSRIVEPTSGRAVLRGRVASLLEVGTGFHRELSGRENIYLNGAILGMKKAEIDRKFDEIVAFSEIEQFLDTPVKHYSSGMYVRLAFAVAAHLEPEILIVDEVLAVGDAEFQKKCLGKMQEVASGNGRTVLFVSHNMGAVRRLCQSAVYLRNGRAVRIGTADEIVEEYLNSGATQAQDHELLHRPRLSHGYTPILSAFRCQPTDGREHIVPGGSAVLEVEYQTPDTVRNATVNIFIDTERSDRVIGFNTRWERGPIALQPGKNVVRCHIDDFNLAPGRYTVDLMVLSNDKIYDHVEKAGLIEVKHSDYFGTGEMPSPGQTRVLKRSRWEV